MAGTNQTTTLHLLAPLSQHTSTVGLVLAGMSLGLVHVLSGPDHLSALATLSVSHDPFQAFSLGVRWGVGHSFGLLLVAALFLGMKGDLNLSRLEYYGELLVGIFMLLMGSAALFSAVGTRQMELAQGQAALEDKDKKFAGEDELEGLLLLLLPAESGEVDNHNQQQHAVLEEHCSCLNLENERTRRMASLGIGVVHGIAGRCTERQRQSCHLFGGILRHFDFCDGPFCFALRSLHFSLRGRELYCDVCTYSSVCLVFIGSG